MGCIKQYLSSAGEVKLQYSSNASTMSKFRIDDMGVWTIVHDNQGNLFIHLENEDYNPVLQDITMPFCDISDFSLCYPNNMFKLVREASNSRIFDKLNLSTGDGNFEVGYPTHRFTYLDATVPVDVFIDVTVVDAFNSDGFLICFKILDRQAEIAKIHEQQCIDQRKHCGVIPAVNCPTPATVVLTNIQAQGIDDGTIIFKYRKVP